jgi:broad-specificity NMP kinase
MKNLIFINGTMGVGKTSTSKELKKMLPKCVFLDGDWCWDMSPFIVTAETKKMVVDNISYILNNFISCSEYENVIFCWVMHEQNILDNVLSKLNTHDCILNKFSLVCSEESLIERIKKDIRRGIRKKDVINRSISRLKNYFEMDTEKIDVSEISTKEAAEIMYKSIIRKL